AMVISWITATALWPWLQIGNPFRQFATAYVHFLAIPMEFTFPSWGQEIATNALPWYYVPTQFFARLPEGFLLLLAAGAVLAGVTAIRFARAAFARWRQWGAAGLRPPGLLLPPPPPPPAAPVGGAVSPPGPGPFHLGHAPATI